MHPQPLRMKELVWRILFHDPDPTPLPKYTESPKQNNTPIVDDEADNDTTIEGNAIVNVDVDGHVHVNVIPMMSTLPPKSLQYKHK